MIKQESIQDYHKSTAINRSRLFRVSKSPEWFRYCEDNPPEKTRALVVGNAFHSLVLEPNEFEKRYAVIPKLDMRTAEGKAYKQQLESEQRELLTADEFETICGMRDSVMQNEIARKLLTGADIETSIYWTDEITGEQCKARPDIFHSSKDTTIIVDLKSCTSADTETFKKEVVKYGYDLQVYMCCNALQREFNNPTEFIFIAVEKTPPFMVNIMIADNYIKTRGERLFREYLGIYSDCKKTDNWYGYLGFANQMNELTLPTYLQAEIDTVELENEEEY